MKKWFIALESKGVVVVSATNIVAACALFMHAFPELVQHAYMVMDEQSYEQAMQAGASMKILESLN